jgi:hypothetical protein
MSHYLRENVLGFNEAKGYQLKPATRTKINKAFDKLTRNTYFKSIPWDKISGILKDNGVVAVQEDNTEWAGFLSGRNGKAVIDLAPVESGRSAGRPATFYTPYTNTMLVLTWHKMESGRYEVVLYVS